VQSKLSINSINAIYEGYGAYFTLELMSL